MVVDSSMAHVFCFGTVIFRFSGRFWYILTLDAYRELNPQCHGPKPRRGCRGIILCLLKR